MVPLLVPQTTEEIVEQAVEDARNTIYFDMGQNIPSAAFQQQHDDLLWSSVMSGGLLGGGLGGAVASNGPAVDPGAITLESIQRMYESIRMPDPPRWVMGVDYASGVEIAGMQVIADPVVPPNEIRYVFPRDTTIYYRQPEGIIEWPAMPAIPEVLQYQYQYRNVMYGIMDAMFGSPETQEQRVARETKRKAAEGRAEQLMFTILKPSQVRQYTDSGWFETEVNGKTYRIHKRGHSQNVELIIDGKPVAAYCAHPDSAYKNPVQDTMISQFLMLQTDEQKFLKTANRTRLM